MTERPSLRERLAAKRAEEWREQQGQLIASQPQPASESTADPLTPRPVTPRPPRIQRHAERVREPQPRRPAATLIGREIHRWMDTTNLSQSQLADRLDCSPGYISRLISGSRDPDRPFAMRLAEVIEVSHADMALLMLGIDPFEARHPVLDQLFRRYTEVLDQEEVLARERAILAEFLDKVKLTPKEQRPQLVEEVAARLPLPSLPGSAAS